MEQPLTLALMGLTVLTSLIGFGSPEVIRDYAKSPYDIVRYGRWYQLVSSGFLHADLGHLFMNMFTLYYFGGAVERLLGGGRFLTVYLGSMIAGGLLTLLFHHRDPNYRALGASGAVSGIVFSFVLFAPFAPIYIFLIPVGIPAVLFAVGYVALSIFGMRRRVGRIGHEAHLGGALGGVLLTVLVHPAALSRFLAHF